jgi:hypothetical protein
MSQFDPIAARKRLGPAVIGIINNVHTGSSSLYLGSSGISADHLLAIQPDVGHRVVRSGADDGNRQHRPRIGERVLEVLDEDCEHKCGLRKRELGADAHPRTGAEWQKGKAMGRLTAEEARRNEGIRIIPQPEMAMQNPRRNYHDGAPRNRDFPATVRSDYTSRPNESPFVMSSTIIRTKTMWQCPCEHRATLY